MKLTRKDAKEMCTLIFQCPYCDDSGALKLHAVKIGYNYGLFGWNWTLYKVQGNDAGIVSGYRSFPADCIPMTHQQIKALRACDSPESMQTLVEKMVSDYWCQKAIEKGKKAEK